MLKRMMSFFVSLILCFSCLTAVSEEKETEQKTEKKADFILAGFEDSQFRSWGENAFFAYMEEATGMVMGLEQFNSKDTWNQAKMSYQKDGEMPDLLFKAALTDQECITMLNQGVLADLKPYLEKCCPNLWKILEENPEYLKAITLPDGRIAALPFINETPMQNCMWINKDFLDTVKKQIPTTIEELEDVLRAFKNNDANRNGTENDEIPMGFLGAFDLKFLAHGFGLYANDYNIFVKDGQVAFMPLEENYREFVTWCHRMYEEGLLDPEGFSTADVVRRQTKEDATPVYGMVLTSTVSNIMPVGWTGKYELVMPFVYEGKQMYRDFAGHVTKGTFAVTTHCRDIEKALSWVDYLYSPEGAALAAAGKENVDYLVDGDGSWRMTERALSDQYHTINTLMISANAMPGISANQFQSRYSDINVRNMVEQMEKMCAVCTRPFPYYTLTQEQQDYIVPIQQQLGYYVDMQLARWVLGEEEITDESFELFEKNLNEAGLQDFLIFWQNIYNTQNK